MTTKLFTDQEFTSAKYNDVLEFECEQCGTVFTKTKAYIVNKLRRHPNGGDASFCSRACHTTHRNDISIAVDVSCSQCGALLVRLPSEIRQSKSGNSFCCQSCAATYNNTHKTTGTRRSKLEVYLEEELTRLYHDLEIVYNGKDAIGSELDIYIPSLSLAFELNGIYHYEPIHGQEKLDSIVANDSSKFRDCISNSISLCIIDSSRQKRFTAKSSAEYVEIICDIINSALSLSNRI